MLLGEGSCTNMTASRLFGARANQFNAHREKVLITIGEAEEGDDHGDPGQRRMSQGIYNRLKEMVDPNDNRVSIERKGAEAEGVDVFTSYLIATNAGGGVPLGAGDRRFSVLLGNRLPLEGNRPDLIKWLEVIRVAGSPGSINALSAIHGELMRRDVSRYRPSVPRTTQAKARMIAEGASPFDRAVESAIELIMEEDLYRLPNRPHPNAHRQHPEGVIVGTALETLMVSGWMADRDREAFLLARNLHNRDRLLQTIISYIRAHARVPEPLASTKAGNAQLRLGVDARVRVYLPRSQDRGQDADWTHDDLKNRVRSFLDVVEKLSKPL
jgi:hypothetical protein